MTQPEPTVDDSTETDPVLLRRGQVALWSARAKRFGYLAVCVAMVVFVIGFIIDFNPVVTTIIVACLVASALLLIPALIFGYGVKAAEQEERGESFHY